MLGSQKELLISCQKLIAIKKCSRIGTFTLLCEHVPKRGGEGDFNVLKIILKFENLALQCNPNGDQNGTHNHVVNTGTVK